jgi:putative endonuclease
MKSPCVYITANRRNGTLYTGVTSDLIKRIAQHRIQPTGFVAKYACNLLVWFEPHGTMESAITREKQIKAGSRQAKLTLIESANPDWHDFYPEITS